MTNHHHVLLETVDGNLARGMQQLNGEYTQGFTRRHAMLGHLVQGRYKAILVQKEAYRLELSRYIALNPFRAGMVTTLDDWPWSSFPFTVSTSASPDWLDPNVLRGQFAGEKSTGRSPGVQAYREFVMAGKGLPSPWFD